MRRTRIFIPAFLSTPSARRATDLRRAGQQLADISIHALREEGDKDDTVTVSGIPISIHALREEGDPKALYNAAQKAVISIHALREEGDLLGKQLHKEFRDFYPRPPRGGRR